MLVHMHLNRYMKRWIFHLAAIDNRRQMRPSVWSNAPAIIIIIDVSGSTASQLQQWFGDLETRSLGDRSRHPPTRSG